jgi:hypothetical protein
MEGTRVRNVVGTIIYSCVLVATFLVTALLWVAYFGATGAAAENELMPYADDILMSAIILTLICLPAWILTAFCLSRDNSKPWHYKTLAVFFIASGIHAALSGSFWAVVQSSVLIAGAVSPMDHWPTRYFRPISIRSIEEALPH